METVAKTIVIKASIGLSDNSNPTVKNFKQLFHAADVALYKAKQNGKNQIYVEK
jgi:diguanylate cyclase (GGDEF)-like protein